MKKFIANATNNVGNGGVTRKVIEFFEYEGDAVLQTKELTISQIKTIISNMNLIMLNQNYKKKIICL